MLSRLRVGQALFFTAAENKRLEVERIVSRHVAKGQGVFVVARVIGGTRVWRLA